MKTIVCLGDSITYGYDNTSKAAAIEQVAMPYPQVLQELLGTKYTVINRGNNGWQTKTTFPHLNKLVFMHKPDLVILMLGINDARGSNYGFPLMQHSYRQYLEKIITEIKLHNIDVLLLTPTPAKCRRVSKFNEIALNLGKELAVPTIDMHSKIHKQLKVDNITQNEVLVDNVHLSQDYYIKLAHIVYNYIKQNDII